MAGTVDLAKLVVKMEAQSEKYLRDLKKQRQETNKWRKKTVANVNKVGKSFRRLAAIAGIGLLTKKMIDNTATQQRALAQLRAGWQSTNGVVGRSVDQMVAEAKRLQGITIFGDEQINEAQSIMLTFTNITEDVFDRATLAAANLSAKMGTDLKSSVIQLGKVLNAPSSQLSALARSGIQFNETQTEMIRNLVKSGDLVAAQTIVLNELETQFGGAAEAARQNFGGALIGLGNVIGDLLEGNGNQGGLNDSAAKIEELTTLLQDPTTIAAVDGFTGAIISGFTSALSSITSVVTAIQDAARSFARFVSGNKKTLAEQAEDVKDEMRQILDQLTSMDQVYAPDIKASFIEKLKVLNKELSEIQGALNLINGGSSDPSGTGESGLGSGGSSLITDPVDGIGFSEDELGAAIDKEIEYYAKRAELAEEFALTQTRIEADIFASRMDFAENALDLIARTAKEGSALQKVAFIAARGIAIAQAIINAEVASVAALAPPPVGLGPVAGLPLAAKIKGLGIASAALIAAQAIPSFLGGGDTGNGSRSGGLDGKGGFSAILHPNETVIDNEMGGGAQVINQNSYDFRGSELSESRVMSMIEQSNEVLKAEIQKMMRKRRF